MAPMGLGEPKNQMSFTAQRVRTTGPGQPTVPWAILPEVNCGPATT